MRDSLLHALNIGTLAFWSSVTGFAALAIWVPSTVPETTVSEAGQITSLGNDFSLGDVKENQAGESIPADALPESVTDAVEPLPAPPVLPSRERLAPLPDLPNSPAPVGRPTAGKSISARLASGHTPGPSYPPYSRRTGQTGTVVVQFTVGASGNVTAASIYTSSSWNLLDQEALRTIRTWQFPPGEEMTLIRPLVFQLPASNRGR